MSRPLTVFLPVPQNLLEATEDLLLDEPSIWLPDARPSGTGRWQATVRLGPVSRDVMCTVSDVRDEPGSLWRDVSWFPVQQAGDRVPVHQALPRFDGELGLHRGRSVLVLNGSYDVPGGRIGELGDTLALGGPARATASRLLADIAARAVCDPTVAAR